MQSLNDDTERALYRAIIESPFDDAPRLVYADWQDEYGDPNFAEFIRLQIAEHRKSPARAFITARESELLAVPGNAGWYPVRPIKMLVVRGFPSVCEKVTTAGWYDAALLCGVHPVTKIDLSDRSPEPIENGQLYRWNYASQTFHESVINGQILKEMGRYIGVTKSIPLAFGTVDQAFEILSFGVINWGRAQHGLPRITKEDVRGTARRP